MPASLRISNPQVEKLLQQMSRKSPFMQALDQLSSMPLPVGMAAEIPDELAVLADMAKAGEKAASGGARELTLDELKKMAAARGVGVSEKVAPQVAQAVPEAPKMVAEEAPKLLKQAAKKAPKAPPPEKPWENVFTSASDAALQPSTIDYPAMRSATAPYDKQVQDTMGQLMELVKREAPEKQKDWMNQISRIITKDPERFAVKGDMEMAGAQRATHLNQLTELLKKLKTARGIAR